MPIQKLSSLVLLQVHAQNLLPAFRIYSQRKDVLFSLRPLSRLFTRSASRKTIGYMASSGRLLHSLTSSITASVTLLMRAGEIS